MRLPKHHRRPSGYKRHLDLEAYERLKPGLLQEHRGKWALICWGELVDTFATSDEAYARGFRYAPPEDAVEFLVFEISESKTPSLKALTEAEHRYVTRVVTAGLRELSEIAHSPAVLEWMRVNRPGKVAS